MKTNDKNKYKDFGDRLSLIMYKQNISNIQLANAMFVSPSTISAVSYTHLTLPTKLEV